MVTFIAFHGVFEKLCNLNNMIGQNNRKEKDYTIRWEAQKKGGNDTYLKCQAQTKKKEEEDKSCHAWVEYHTRAKRQKNKPPDASERIDVSIL